MIEPANSEGFTPLMDLIAEATSNEAAAKLVEVFPGKRLYIPIGISEQHEISQVIGFEHAQKLSRKFGGLRADLPTGASMRNANRDRRIIDEYYNNGASTLELGRKHSLSPRQIMRIVKGQDNSEESQT